MRLPAAAIGYTGRMCGRMTLPSKDEAQAAAKRLNSQLGCNAAEAALGEGVWEGLGWGGQSMPGSSLPVLAPASLAGSAGASGSAGPAAGLSLLPLTWGYILPSDGKLVYNARIESAKSPLWRTSFTERRGLVLTRNFFEPHRSEMQRHPETGRLGKRSFAFCSPDGETLLLGAIFQGDRVSVVTTAPNRQVEPIHPRMPLVLSFSEVPQWLGPTWQGLADRSACELKVSPEFDLPPGPVQETLF